MFRGCSRGAWGLEAYKAVGLRAWRCIVDDGDDGDDVGRVEGLQRNRCLGVYVFQGVEFRIQSLGLGCRV